MPSKVKAHRQTGVRGERRKAALPLAPPAAPAWRRAGVKTHAGQLAATGLRFALVVSRFNGFITERLLDSAADTLLRLGARARDLEVVRVPGAFEIPAAARRAADTGRFQAIICLGLILRGETPHFHFIGREVARGVGQAALESGVPHSFGVLTCDTLEDAVQRAGLKAGSKGAEAALVAVEMANLFWRQLADAPSSDQRERPGKERPRRNRRGARRKAE